MLEETGFGVGSFRWDVQYILKEKTKKFMPGGHLVSGLFTLGGKVNKFMRGVIYQAVLRHFPHSFGHGRHTNVFPLGNFFDAGDAAGINQLEDNFEIIFLRLGDGRSVRLFFIHTT